MTDIANNSEPSLENILINMEDQKIQAELEKQCKEHVNNIIYLED